MPATTTPARLAAVVAFADELRELGPANFIYSDGDAVFAHGHRRKSASGEILPPGLHVLCRGCAARSEGMPLTGVEIGFEVEQQVALLASMPLSRERWEPLSEGEIVVLREGRVVQRQALVGGKRARLRS